MPFQRLLEDNRRQNQYKQETNPGSVLVVGQCILENGLWSLKIEKGISTLKNTFSHDENSLWWFKQVYPPLILKTHEIILLLMQIIEEAGQENLSQESPIGCYSVT